MPMAIFIFVPFKHWQKLLQNKLPPSTKNRSLTPFYKQVLECWLGIHGNKPCTTEEICNELIFQNKFICSNNKPLQTEMLILPNIKTITELKVNDVLKIMAGYCL